MKLSQVKSILEQSDKISFTLPNGALVPSHFHVTEVGQVQKDFVDCGGVVRAEKVAVFQLWEANDYDHRLHPEKLINIIELCQKTIGIADLDVEVEYQGETIGKYELGHDGESFLLLAKKTACLAQDMCGIPENKKKVSLSELVTGGCTPGSGCC